MTKRSSNVRAYRLTPESYDRRLAAQGGGCGICGGHAERHALSIDHWHTAELVRGILCTRCNMGLGFFLDDPSRLQEAIHYLDWWHVLHCYVGDSASRKPAVRERKAASGGRNGGRKATGETPMTAAERKRRQRANERRVKEARASFGGLA